jgi:hypothetical protein
VASATEPLPKPETKPPVRKGRSFHVRYRRLILSARVLLSAALLIGTIAISLFIYDAVAVADSYGETVDSQGVRQATLKDPDWGELFVSKYNDMRFDAAAALLGVALVLGSVHCYRKARRYKPRAPIRPVRERES